MTEGKLALMLDDFFQDYRWNEDGVLTEERLEDWGAEPEWENLRRGDMRNG